MGSVVRLTPFLIFNFNLVCSRCDMLSLLNGMVLVGTDIIFYDVVF